MVHTPQQLAELVLADVRRKVSHRHAAEAIHIPGQRRRVEPLLTAGAEASRAGGDSPARTEHRGHPAEHRGDPAEPGGHDPAHHDTKQPAAAEPSVITAVLAHVELHNCRDYSYSTHIYNHPRTRDPS